VKSSLHRILKDCKLQLLTVYYKDTFFTDSQRTKKTNRFAIGLFDRFVYLDYGVGDITVVSICTGSFVGVYWTLGIVEGSNVSVGITIVG
jgi:hypothetical protein